MKGSEKRWKPDRTNSVIAVLMGLDELHPIPPIHEKRRGLSESYVRDSASIVLRPGSLVSSARSCSTNNELVCGVNGVPTSDRVVNSRASSNRKGVRNSRTVSAPVSSSLSRASYGNRKSIGKNDEHCAKHVLRCNQKLEHDSLHLGELGIGSVNKSLNSRLQMIDNTSPLSTSISTFKKQNFNRWNARKAQEFGVSGRKQSLSQMLALTDQISKPRKLDVKHCKTGSCSPSSLMSRSSFSSSTDVVDDESLKGLPVSECGAVKDIHSTGWNLTRYEPHAIENNSNNQATLCEGVLESTSGRGCKQFQTSLDMDETMSPDSKVSELSGCSFSCCSSTFNDPETYILGIRNEMDSGSDYEPSARVKVSFRSNGDLAESESNNGALLEEGGEPSSVEEVSCRKESLDEDSAYSNFAIMVHQESTENLKRTNQHSPNSVLESFNIDNSSFKCFDSIGLRLQLESLNFETRETYSEEGSIMYVSGDEDAHEKILDLSYDSRKVRSWLRDGDSRNFSYVVDILDEAGFRFTNSHMDFKMWHSLECPISRLVFEALERKYGKQTSWMKSERQLLFDRINSALLEIFNPIINLSRTSMHQRLSASFRLGEVVDELWMKLVSQEKEKRDDLYKKPMEKWFEFEEGIDIICREFENSLFDELVMEFASLWG